MGKHIHWKIKYHYVMRYLNGESATKLGLEIINKGLSNHKSENAKPGYIILRWKYQYYGLGLNNKSGRPKKKKDKEIDYDQFTNEELKEIIRIKDEYIKIIQDQDKKKKFSAINKIKKITFLSLNKLFILFNVSKKGYYKWIKNDKPLHGKYDPKLVNAIQNIYYKNNGNYGYPRIHISLQRELGIIVNINTVRRYMKHLNLKAKIRVKRKNRERKDIYNKIPNLIDRNFKSDKMNHKWYTNVSYIQLKDKWAYCSVIIDGSNNELIDIKLSLHNNNELVLSNIKNAIKNKDVSNLIIHSDHGYQYSSFQFKRFLNRNNIKQSMSRIGNSLDNRPAEYFFSVLKQEYLRTLSIKDRTFDNVNKEMEYIKWHYNNARFQSNLQNKTPCEYMTL